MPDLNFHVVGAEPEFKGITPLMETYHPNLSWLYLDRDIFDELYAFKRRHSIPTWDATVSRLLDSVQEKAL